MRYFFLLFFCLGFTFFGFANIAKADEKPQKIAIDNDVLTGLFANGTDDSSLLSEGKGIGTWIQTPYGKIRLLSRESGTKDLDQVLMALDAIISPDITLKQPHLKIVQAQNVKDFHFLTPVAVPLQQTLGLSYKDSAVFPFILNLEKSNFPVQVSIEFDVQYCTDEVCQADLQTVSLKIPNGYNYFTPFSSFIDDSLKFVPTTATKNQIQTGYLSNNTFWVMLQLPKKIQKPTFLFSDPQTLTDIPYTIIQSEVDGKKALFVFKTQQDVQDKRITLFFNSEKQLFTQTTVLTKSEMPPFLPSPKNDHIPFSLWVAFLLFSPCLCLLTQRHPRNEIVAKQMIVKSIFGIILGVLCGVPIYMIFPYAELSQSVLWLTFGLILFGFLGICSYPITSFGYGLLTAIVPIFSFLKNAEISVPASFNELVLFFASLSVLNVLPFFIFLLKPYLLVKTGKLLENQNDYRFRVFFFLDALLFGYLLLFALFG